MFLFLQVLLNVPSMGESQGSVGIHRLRYLSLHPGGQVLIDVVQAENGRVDVAPSLDKALGRNNHAELVCGSHKTLLGLDYQQYTLLITGCIIN